MRTALLALLVVVASAPAYPPVPKPKPKKVDKLDLKALEGTWTVVSYEYGRPKNAKVIGTTITYQTIEIKNGTWVQVRTLPNGGTSRTVPYKITLDASKSPMVLDMEYRREPPPGAAGGVVVSSSKRHGLARLDGDQLTVVYSLSEKDRPAKIDGDLDVRVYRWVMKRAKP